MQIDFYKAPKGIKIKPSEVGHYNFWYPHAQMEDVSIRSFVFEKMPWWGSSKWKPIKVSPELAKNFNSPIRVIWIEADIYKKIVAAPDIREGLKKRAMKYYEQQ